MTAALRDPLRRFLAGATLSLYGDWLTTVAVVVLVVRVTGSSAAPAAYMLARVLPRILGTGPGGVLADRHSGARVVAACSMGQALLTLAIIPAAHARAGAGIFAAVAATQLLNGVSRSALGSIIPTVAAPERLRQANALYSLSIASSLVIGPALGALLLTTRGPDPLLVLDAASFVVAAGLMLTLPQREVRVVSPTRGALVGLRVVAADAHLRALAAAYLGEAMATTVAGSVLVLAAADRLGGEGAVGLLYAAVGLGDVIAGTVVLRRGPSPGNQRFGVVAAAVAAMLGLAVFSVTHSLAEAMLPLMVTGMGETAYVTWGATDMQTRTPGDVLGRVSAAVVSAQYAGSIVGALIALVLVPAISWDRTLLVTAGLGIVIVAAGSIGPSRAAVRIGDSA